MAGTICVLLRRVYLGSACASLGLLLGGWLSACGSEERKEQRAPLACDGGDDVMFAMRGTGDVMLAMRGTDVIAKGAVVVQMSPWREIYVNQNCEYWADSGLLSVYGFLSPALTNAIDNVARLDELVTTSGEFAAQGCVADEVVTRGGGVSLECYCGCEDWATPERERAAVEQFEEIMNLAIVEGQPVSGFWPLPGARNRPFGNFSYFSYFSYFSFARPRRFVTTR